MSPLDKGGFESCGLGNPVKLPLKLFNEYNKQPL